jgi:dihydrofolate synthase/folylpolyglutamate synthase
MFHRIGAAAYKADLSNTLALCRLLHHPENDFKSIHIAGTNGKGSTSHFIASVLQESGYRTGLFTSPHLKDFRERIKINGKMIAKKEVSSFVENYLQMFSNIEPSFFEWTFALAMWHFSRQKVDVAVIETGMGGRLDSTNVINPLLSIITNIGLDHTQFLGKDISTIAAEKAGIIKHGIPVVVGEYHPESSNVFVEAAKKASAEIVFADQQYNIDSWSYTTGVKALLNATLTNRDKKTTFSVSSPLTGNYQLKNLATSLCSLHTIAEQLTLVNDNSIEKGIRNVLKNTALKGRWQVISTHPLTIADMGHNVDGITQVVKQIELTPHDKLHFVLGVVNDKDIDAMLKLLPSDASYYFCKADIPRGLDAALLAEKAATLGLKGNVYSTVNQALHDARKYAAHKDLIVVGGSAFVVAEVV